MPFLEDILIVGVYKALSVALWIVVPIFAAVLCWKMRLFYKRYQFIQSIEWNMLQIRIPHGEARSPKSMEQVFASLFGIYSFGIPALNKYLDGKVDIWISFEMVARGGGISFYVRTPKDYRNLVESALYAQYPDAEISETTDYMDDLPSVLPNDTYDLWGTGFTLVKNSVYPIRTYHDFFHELAREEERIDPLAPLFEAMSKLKDDEMVCIQLLISPTGPATGVSIKDDAQKEIKAIIEKKKDEEGKSDITGGDRDVINAIENKASKHVFQTNLRFAYIDKKDSFSFLNISSVMGSFQQFNTQHMNSLRPDKLITVAGGIKMKLFPKIKKTTMLRKKRILFDYLKTRRFGYTNRLVDETFPILSSEELATLFHFPLSSVRAPRLGKIDSRKGTPPVNLPLE